MDKKRNDPRLLLLSNSVLTHVTGFLDAGTLLLHVAQVCKRLENMVRNHAIYHVQSTNDDSMAFAAWLMRVGSRVRSLHISHLSAWHLVACPRLASHAITLASFAVQRPAEWISL